MTITLPFPPLLNHYYYHRGVKRVLSNEGRAYKLSTLVRAKAQGMRLLDGPVCVSLVFFRRARRGDIDGGLKCLLDALQGVGYRNDSQIRELHALQLEDSENPRVQVSVSAWQERAA